MAEELQPLLDKIQSEGLAKAKAAADEIAAKARADAEAVLNSANAEAAAIREGAESDAARMRAAGVESLRQAARDVELKVASDIRATLERMLLADVSSALSDPAALARCVETAVAADAASAAGAQVLVAPDAAEALAKRLLSSAAAKAASGDGLRIVADDGVSAGFRVFVQDGRVEHDFTAEAVAEALSKAVRPSLSKLVFGK